MQVINARLERQRLNEEHEAQLLFERNWQLRDPKIKIACLLKSFLEKEMPSLDPAYARRLFILSPELQKKFRMILLAEGLLNV